MAAGSLLVLEAGGLVADFDGEQGWMDSGNVLAASPKIFTQMLAGLNPRPRSDSGYPSRARPPSGMEPRAQPQAARDLASSSGMWEKAVDSASAAVAVGAITDTLR